MAARKSFFGYLALLALSPGLTACGGTSGAPTSPITPTAVPAARVVERISVASDGSQADKSDIEASSVSADGRFVAFESIATNLVPGDTNSALDVFLRDTCRGAAPGCVPSTLRVSVASDGSQGSPGVIQFAYRPSVSADGRFVAFHSSLSGLVIDDTNGVSDVFVRDTCQGAPVGCTPNTVRASIASDGSQGDDWSSDPAMSADGRFVAFASYATNLVAGDTNGFSDIFVRDTCIGAPPGCTPSTVLASMASDGSQGFGDVTSSPAISADGRFVAFQSDSNLVPNDTNADIDIFVRDTCQGAPAGCAPSTSRVSVASDGSQANNHSFFPAISADGRFVAFQSDASNLVPDDTNAATDIFVRDTCQGVPAGCTPSTVRVSVGVDGSQANNNSFGFASISADGRFVAFPSDASNLVPNDINGFRDVFVRDTCQGAPAGCTPSTVLVSMASDGNHANGGSFLPSISADGRFVTLESEASNLVPGDSNGARDVFLAVTGFAGATVNTSSDAVRSFYERLQWRVGLADIHQSSAPRFRCGSPKAKPAVWGAIRQEPARRALPLLFLPLQAMAFRKSIAQIGQRQALGTQSQGFFCAEWRPIRNG